MTHRFRPGKDVRLAGELASVVLADRQVEAKALARELQERQAAERRRLEAMRGR